MHYRSTLVLSKNCLLHLECCLIYTLPLSIDHGQADSLSIILPYFRVDYPFTWIIITHASHTLHTLRSLYNTNISKIVDFKPKNSYTGGSLLNRSPTQTSWLILSHLAGVVIFAQSSSSNLCTSLMSATHSSTARCIKCMQCSDASLLMEFACLFAYVSYI